MDSRKKARDGSNQGTTIFTIGDAENLLSNHPSHIIFCSCDALSINAARGFSVKGN